ncbi:hypothetical protein HH214_03800 [Mucilaginibacter robiniae]|uniref:Uncharacterized protein n=1 Tax=Mucilaginibacter robiniae TaxID=2728022 RepID=A0A7L5DWD0_9SPHI|nr:DUF6702 family protein [Mucilaginibacter robiniae]QJD95061.1 hypothetical protein HH214_03800 [Mucilaginibacter robiniae]
MYALIYQSVLYCYLFTGSSFFGHKPLPVPHPLHVSTSDISYNGQDNKLEVTCTIFTDDFEQALAKQYNTKTDLTKPTMHTAMDALVKNYINSHLHIRSGAGTIVLNYLGYEIDREAVNVYLESNKLPVIKKETADVSLLHNLYDDQINIVHMTVNSVRKSTKLEYPNTKVSQDF